MTTTPTLAAPVIRDDLTADAYHADRTSISSSGLRALLAPGCPAQFKYDRDNPRPAKKEFDLGHAAHALILGDGPSVEVVEGARWDTNVTKAKVKELRSKGIVPLKEHEMAQVEAMAEAIRRHPHAGPLFTPGNGVAERSIFWTHEGTGVRVRVRPDWLIVRPDVTIVVDLKTTTDASPEACSKAIASYGYHQQGALYLDGVEAAGLAPEGGRFVFVFQSKKPPYLVTVRELADQDQDIGRARNDRALQIYADCVANDEWPDWTGRVTEIPQIGMPSWETLRQAEEYLG